MIVPPRFTFPILNRSKFSLFALLAKLNTISGALGNPQIDHELNINVMEWAKAHGAFIHEHVKIRYIGEGLSGLFASQSITEGEIISTVPFNLATQSVFVNDDHDNNDKGLCNLFYNVHSSIIKNETIQTPYEKYLTSRTHHHLPLNWSPQAKKMLKELDGPSTAPLFGFEFQDIKERIQDCGGFDENMAMYSKFADAVSLTYTHYEGVKGRDHAALVPFMDLINHANGKRSNTDSNHVLDEKFEFIATRAIEKGEQLYFSYSRCSYCGSCFEDGSFVTPHLFFHYGFVETLPQRWAFENIDLIFDIDKKEGPSDDELEVNFVEPPTKADIYFMKKELKRLSFFRRDLMNSKGKILKTISEFELDSISKFLQALVDAFTHALESAEVHHTEEIGDYSLDSASLPFVIPLTLLFGGICSWELLRVFSKSYRT
mmetsp:Transcript_14644/g.19112  ORF Transcript_14644/g.19112 Transcript_14644/m.19112 type:complete len:431 (+) Transcript_14644:89-1381(+)